METIEDDIADVLRSDPDDWLLHHRHFTASKAAALAALSEHKPARTRQEMIAEYKNCHNLRAPAPAVGVKAEGWRRQPTSVKHFLILTARLRLNQTEENESLDDLIKRGKSMEFWPVGRLTYTGVMPTAGVDRLQDRSLFWEERNQTWRDVLQTYTAENAWMSASPTGERCSISPPSTFRRATLGAQASCEKMASAACFW